MFTHVNVGSVTNALTDSTSIPFLSTNVVGKILTQPSTGATGVIETSTTANVSTNGVFVLSNVKGNFVPNSVVYVSDGSATDQGVLIPVLTKGANACLLYTSPSPRD